MYLHSSDRTFFGFGRNLAFEPKPKFRIILEFRYGPKFQFNTVEKPVKLDYFEHFFQKI